MSSIKREDLNGFEQCFSMIEEGVESLAKGLTNTKSFEDVYASTNAFMYFIHQVKLVLHAEKAAQPAIIIPFASKTLKEVSKNE